MYAVSDEDVELLRKITQASGRPATWLALFAHPGQPDYHDQTFAKLGDLVKQAIPQVTPRPIMSQGDLKNPTMFGSFVSWQKAFNRPAAEQMALYRDPAFREAFRQELESRKRSHMWGQMRVLEVGRPELAGHVGRTLEEIAASQGKRPVDAYFDLGLADDLATRFQSSTFNFDPAGIERLITDDRCLIGLSDGGAHVDFICDVGYATALLDLWVRQRGRPEPREGRAQADAGARRAVRHSQPRRAPGGQGGRPRPVRSGDGDGEAARGTPTICRAMAGASSPSPRASRRRSWRARSSTRTASTRARCPAASSAATSSGARITASRARGATITAHSRPGAGRSRRLRVSRCRAGQFAPGRARVFRPAAAGTVQNTSNSRPSGSLA